MDDCKEPQQANSERDAAKDSRESDKEIIKMSWYVKDASSKISEPKPGILKYGYYSGGKEWQIDARHLDIEKLNQLKDAIEQECRSSMGVFKRIFIEAARNNSLTITRTA